MSNEDISTQSLQNLIVVAAAVGNIPASPATEGGNLATIAAAGAWHPGVKADKTVIVQPADLALTASIVKIGTAAIKGGRAYKLAVIAASGTSPSATWYARFQVVPAGGAAPTVMGDPVLPGASGTPFTMPGVAADTYDLYGVASTDASTNLSAILLSGQEP